MVSGEATLRTSRSSSELGPDHTPFPLPKVKWEVGSHDAMIRKDRTKRRESVVEPMNGEKPGKDPYEAMRKIAAEGLGRKERGVDV